MAMWYLLLMCERLLVGGLGSPKSVMEPDWVSGARIGIVLDAFWDFLATFSGRRNKFLEILGRFLGSPGWNRGAPKLKFGNSGRHKGTPERSGDDFGRILATKR